MPTFRQFDLIKILMSCKQKKSGRLCGCCTCSGRQYEMIYAERNLCTTRHGHRRQLQLRLCDCRRWATSAVCCHHPSWRSTAIYESRFVVLRSISCWRLLPLGKTWNLSLKCTGHWLPSYKENTIAFTRVFIGWRDGNIFSIQYGTVMFVDHSRTVRERDNRTSNSRTVGLCNVNAFMLDELTSEKETENVWILQYVACSQPQKRK